MKLLDGYISKTVLSSIGLVTFMLVGLELFMMLVGELHDLGRMDYHLPQALVFVLLQIPYQLYLFFPMATLLGALIGLGLLANHSELVVMRASGLSIFQITGALFKTAVGLIVLVTVLGETFLPSLVSFAHDYKTQALSGGQTLRTAKGLWLRHHQDFISIAEISSPYKLKNISQFHFSSTNDLVFARHIDEASYTPFGWEAEGVEETHFVDNKTVVSKKSKLAWDVVIRPKILSITSVEPDEMTLRELNRYIKEQTKNQQSAHNYQLAFFQRIMQPFTTMVMMILAIPFIFGPLRSSSMGSKLLAGSVVGFGFHIINRFFGPLSTVFQLSATVAAIGPTLVFAVLGLYLMGKMKS